MPGREDRQAFARIVVHHDLFLWDAVLLRGTARLAAVLVHGRFDLQAPLADAWELARAWPGAKRVVVDDAGHGAPAALKRELRRATDRFVGR